MCLEAAIKEIEADALRNQRAQAVMGGPSITLPLSLRLCRSE
jgi:hypothetical protein